MKKVISMFLTIVMLFSVIPAVQAEESAVSVNPKQAAALKLICDMKLLSGEKADADTPATRSALAEVAVRGMGFPEQAAAETMFSDVKSDEEKSGYILAAYRSNLMLGYSDGRFDPNGNVSIEQVVKVLCRMTGYSILAESEGGDLAAYQRAAGKAGFLKGLSVANSKQVTLGELAYAVKKALNTDMMELAGIAAEQDEYTITKGKTLLSNKLELYTVSGQVTANYFTGLAGASALSKGQIELNRKTYYSDLTDISSYLGCEVILYLSQDDDSVVAVEREHKAEDTELLLDSENILNISADTIRYMDENENTESISYAPDGCLIYNGLAKLSWSKADLLAVNNGELKLLDSDADGIYDIVFAVQYTDLVIDRISMTNETVYFESGSVPEKLDLSNRNKIKLDLTDQNGESISVNNLAESNVLSVALSAGNAVCIAVQSAVSVVGECTQIDDDEAVIDGQVYPLNAALKADNGRIELNKRGVFRLNYMGKLVSVDYDSAQLYNYGYLIAVDTKKGLSSEISFRMLTSGGSVEYFKLAERVRINGAKAQNRESVKSNSLLFPSGSLKEQMITYDVNADGEISSFHTAADGSAMDKTERLKTFSLDAHYDGGSSDYRTRYVSGNNWKMFASKYVLDDKCKVFILPTDNSPDDDGYGVYGVSSLIADTFYEDVQIFDADENNVVPVIAVRGVQAHYAGKTIGIVTNVSEALDKEGNMATKLTVFADGAEVSLFPNVDDLKVFTQCAITDKNDTACMDQVLVDGVSYDKNKAYMDITKLEPGDVIRYSVNADGKATILEVLFRNRLPYLSETESGLYLNESWPHQKTAAPPEFYYYGTSYAGFVRVLDVMNDGILGKTKWKTYNYQAQAFMQQGDAQRLYRLGGARLIRYDVNRKSAAAISAAEIEKDDLVFIYATTAGPTAAVVYQ